MHPPITAKGPLAGWQEPFFVFLLLRFGQSVELAPSTKFSLAEIPNTTSKGLEQKFPQPGPFSTGWLLWAYAPMHRVVAWGLGNACNRIRHWIGQSSFTLNITVFFYSGVSLNLLECLWTLQILFFALHFSFVQFLCFLQSRSLWTFATGSELEEVLFRFNSRKNRTCK